MHRRRVRAVNEVDGMGRMLWPSFVQTFTGGFLGVAILQVMAANFGAVGGEHFTSEGGSEDMFPYVSFTVNVEA